MSRNGKVRLRLSVRSLLAGGVVAAVLVVAALSAAPGDPPADEPIDVDGTPVLQLDNDYVDFGDVPHNEMVEASFQITNAGDATLLFAEKPFIEVRDGC